jgi:hypothetical protein
MKHISKFFALAIVMIAFSATSFGQVSATATASATIITPISIAKTVDMNFGNVVTSAATGTVVLAPAGTRTAGGGASLIAAQPGTVTAATFTVSGSAGLTYTIALPASVTIANGAPTMLVDNFTSTPVAGTGTGTIGGGGTQTLLVGATLNVGANQAPGTYTTPVATPFTVTVNYN